MNKDPRAPIVYIDDNQDMLKLVERILSDEGYEIITAISPSEGIDKVKEEKPDVVLLDINMPSMDGYKVCSVLQEDKETSFIPVIFLTALETDKDKAKAFSAGGVDYLVKPIKKDSLLPIIEKHIKTRKRWEKLAESSQSIKKKVKPLDFERFLKFLSYSLDLPEEEKNHLLNITPREIYSIPPEINIDSKKMAEYISGFLGLPYTPTIEIESVHLGSFPAPFCNKNLLVPRIEPSGEETLVISNPFDWDLMDVLDKFWEVSPNSRLIITEPENIEKLFKEPQIPKEDVLKNKVLYKKEEKAAEGVSEKYIAQAFQKKEEEKHKDKEEEGGPVIEIANSILTEAIKGRASDIHIEPKKDESVVRFRIDGDMLDHVIIKKKTSQMVISRLKLLAGLDIAERRRPQDGSFSREIADGVYSFRIATTSTPNGESVVVRILKPYSKPKTLLELGMTEKQASTLVDCGNQHHGMILVVGGTGSGKTTTVYSLLSQIDTEARSLMSVEDPVEYRIPSANQQQVNEKAGISFEELLKSSVRQDPDILYMGEVRDPYSAKTAVDFASTGHLTISTLHTSNATSAIFRLERLNVTRLQMSESLLCIVAQKLIKKPCQVCSKIVHISDEQRNLLAPFTDDIPERVLKVHGCPNCNNTGYYGREGVYEVLKFDEDVIEEIRKGTPISEIRSLFKEKSYYLLGDHAIEKVRSLIFTPEDIYGKILVEEVPSGRTEKITGEAQKKVEKEEVAESKTTGLGEKKETILIVEDDADSRNLIARFLTDAGYMVTLAEDGAAALLDIGRKDFDLIISDVNMPNLDGLALMGIIKQKGIKTPVILLTSLSASEDEIKGLEKGASDYLKKPVKKELLLLRVKNLLSV
jgi:type II secretory ATPase GspE/PulE/Tfp pilus assembly ATPase PilB-like protein/DNA-binding response OmpR family regulator